MPSTREMRLRIRSVKNIAQVTRALEAVSASKVRRATQAVTATTPYAEKAWKVLVHLARQPGHNSLHPLLKERDEVKRVLVLMVSGDRGLAGAYNVNILRYTLESFKDFKQPVSFVVVGRKGRDLLPVEAVDPAISTSRARPSFSQGLSGCACFRLCSVARAAAFCAILNSAYAFQ